MRGKQLIKWSKTVAASSNKKRCVRKILAVLALALGVNSVTAQSVAVEADFHLMAVSTNQETRNIIRQLPIPQGSHHRAPAHYVDRKSSASGRKAVELDMHVSVSSKTFTKQQQKAGKKLRTSNSGNAGAGRLFQTDGLCAPAHRPLQWRARGTDLRRSLAATTRYGDDSNEQVYRFYH